MIPLRILGLGLVLSVLPCAGVAQELDAAQAGEVVDALSRALDSYVDPALGARMKAMVQASRPRYAQATDREPLAQALSKDLLEASHDLHLKVTVRTASAQSTQQSPEQEAMIERRLASGLMAIRRLPGNIGYLKLRYFPADDAAAGFIDSAMQMLKDTDALIIDLRQNTGGGGATDARLLGHLSRTPIVMTAIHWRHDGRTDIEQRQVSVPSSGPLYPDKPVYVLTANRTFSAAEGFTYDLKVARRATIIGEKTRGGGNPSDRPFPLGYGLSVFMPNGRAVHPLTGGGWEGKGIAPDVAVPPEAALTEAYRRALQAAPPVTYDARAEKERTDALADPRAALLADQLL